MARYSSGDTIVCKIWQDRIVYSTAVEYETKQHFDIICLCDEGYLVLVPADLFIKNSFILETHNYVKYGAMKKFIGAQVHYITDNHIVELKSVLQGYFCARCNEFYDFSEINDLDNNGKGIYICYLCRVNPWR